MLKPCMIVRDNIRVAKRLECAYFAQNTFQPRNRISNRQLLHSCYFSSAAQLGGSLTVSADFDTFQCMCAQPDASETTSAEKMQLLKDELAPIAHNSANMSVTVPGRSARNSFRS